MTNFICLAALKALDEAADTIQSQAARIKVLEEALERLLSASDDDDMPPGLAQARKIASEALKTWNKETV